MKGPLKSKKCPPHEPNGWVCMVGHGDGKGQCPQCKHCGRYYRPGDEMKPIEIDYCDKCEKREANSWSNPEYYPENGGWRCDKCRVVTK